MSNGIVLPFRGRDLSGRRFGRWYVIEFAGRDQHKQPLWRCRCDCGKDGIVYGLTLKNGRSQSCGCLHNEQVAQRATKHGGSKRTEYRVWMSMKNRCLYPSNPGYKDYGGRGITICQRWLDSFEAFLADMGPRPEGSRKFSIERRDVNGNYEPGNCYWATWAQQSRNTRRNRLLTHNGITLPLTDWAAKIGVNQKALDSRLRLGWSVGDALATPFRVRRKRINGVLTSG